jgi:hypothetical protein
MSNLKEIWEIGIGMVVFGLIGMIILMIGIWRSGK